MPMCRCECRAACSATSTSAPVRSTISRATSSTSGSRSRRVRARERIVGSRSASLGAHSSQMVCSGGSSRALSSTFDVRSVIRSASSITITRYRPSDGPKYDRSTSARACLIVMMTPSVRSAMRSGWVPASTWRMVAWSSGVFAMSAAANACASVERPEPGGPVMSQACAGDPSSCAARCKVLTASCWPRYSPHGSSAAATEVIPKAYRRPPTSPHRRTAHRRTAVPSHRRAARRPPRSFAPNAGYTPTDTDNDANEAPPHNAPRTARSDRRDVGQPIRSATRARTRAAISSGGRVVSTTTNRSG